MVNETEDKMIPSETLNRSILLLMKNERLGSIYKHLCRNPNDKNNSEGTFMVTFEYNIYEPSSIVYWFASVNNSFID